MFYNRAFDFAFEVICQDEEGEDITPAMIRANRLSNREILEACGSFDVHEEEDESLITNKISYQMLIDPYYAS
jgi:hypothetical protein